MQLGGLAANLARVSSFSGNPINRQVVNSLLDESKFFIEWAAGEAKAEVAEQLVEPQIQLASWRLDWDRICTDQARRAEMVEQSRTWSDKILHFSGLLNQ